MAEQKSKKVESQKISELVEKSMGILQEVTNKLLGINCELKPMGGMLLDLDSVVNCFKSSYYPLKATFDKGFEGRLFLFLDEKAVITLSSILLGHGPELIKERLKEELIEGLMTDAFSEIGNQLFGGLDRLWSKKYRSDLHLKKDFTPVVPHESEEALKFFSGDDRINTWVTWIAKLKLPFCPETKLIFLFPKNFSEWAFGEEATRIDGKRFGQIIAMSPEGNGERLIPDAFALDGYVVEEIGSPKGLSRLLNTNDRPISMVILNVTSWQGLAKGWTEKLTKNPSLQGIPFVVFYENLDLDEIKEIEKKGVHAEPLPKPSDRIERIQRILEVLSPTTKEVA